MGDEQRAVELLMLDEFGQPVRVWFDAPWLAKLGCAAAAGHFQDGDAEVVGEASIKSAVGLNTDELARHDEGGGTVPDFEKAAGVPGEGEGLNSLKRGH